MWPLLVILNLSDNPDMQMPQQQQLSRLSKVSAVLKLPMHQAPVTWMSGFHVLNARLLVARLGVDVAAFAQQQKALPVLSWLYWRLVLPLP